MQNKLLILLIVIISGFSQLALAEDINVTDADYVGNFTLNNNTNVIHLNGEPGVMAVKYADSVSYLQLENPTSVEHLVGEPGVMVVKYADVISYNPLDNPTSVSRRELNMSIDYPSNGDIILNSSVTVNGTAFSPNEIINVTVNGILANGTTSWNATIPLITGINIITVKATTNTTYSETKTIKVFHYMGGECSYYDIDGDGVIDVWDQENNTQSGFWVNPVGIGRMLGDLNGNGMLDSGDVTLLMRMIAGLIT